MRCNLIALAGAGLALLLVSCAGGGPSRDPNALGPNWILPRTRMEAPAFTLPSLEQQETPLRSFAGRVVLLHFWATWCRPCRDELPALQRLQDRFGGEGFVVVAIATDRGGSGRVAAMVKELGLTYPVLHDRDGSSRTLYEVERLPWTYLIGRDGKFDAKIVGASHWDEGAAREFVSSLLERPRE